VKEDPGEIILAINGLDEEWPTDLFILEHCKH